MDTAAICGAIITGRLADQDLNQIIEAVKLRRQQLVTRMRRSLTIGDRVGFTSTRTGQELEGTVQKVAVKYITVKTDQGLWRVPANMLQFRD